MYCILYIVYCVLFIVYCLLCIVYCAGTIINILKVATICVLWEAPKSLFENRSFEIIKRVGFANAPVPAASESCPKGGTTSTMTERVSTGVLDVDRVLLN